MIAPTRLWTAGMPHLDVHTLSEDWALATAVEDTWACLALSLGQRPSDWRDGAGVRMYAGVMALTTWFDLDNPVQEDDAFTTSTQLAAIRKPHALAETTVEVAGQCRARVRILTSLIRRDTAGSNKKFSKVRDVWLADDLNPDQIDALLTDHHLAKTEGMQAPCVLNHEVNRITDFNAADLLYFKNFVRIAKAAEWKANRGAPPRLNTDRICYYFGNADDGDVVSARVERTGDATRTELTDRAGNRLFLSRAKTALVQIAQR